MSSLLPRLPKRSRSARAMSAAERRDRRRLAARARKRHAGQRVRVLGDEPAPEERAQRMAEEDDWRARLLGGDQAVQGPEVADDLVPSALVGEMAEIGRRGLRPVAAMIVGVNGVARGVERRRQTRVAAAVLGEAMGDLDHRARRRIGKPAPPQEGLAVVGAKREFAPRHSRPRLARPRQAPRFLARDLARVSLCRQARASLQVAFGSNHGRHCERSEAIQGNVGSPTFSGLLRRLRLLAMTIPSEGRARGRIPLLGRQISSSPNRIPIG